MTTIESSGRSVGCGSLLPLEMPAACCGMIPTNMDGLTAKALFKTSTAKLAKGREMKRCTWCGDAQTAVLFREVSRVSWSNQIFAFEKSDVASGEQTKEIHRETREKTRK
jgi:hypothetical protein